MKVFFNLALEIISKIDYNEYVIITLCKENNMGNIKINVDTLKQEHDKIELALQKEQSYVWKNITKIEKLKKAKLRKKDDILRESLITS